MFCVDTQLQEVPCDTPGAWLVLTREELAQMSPWLMDTESAVRLSSALLMIFAVAFVIRVIRKQLETEERNEE